METILIDAAKIVIYSLACGAAVLIVGGAVKKVVSDPPDECIDAGTKLAQLIIARSALSLGANAAKMALPSA